MSVRLLALDPGITTGYAIFQVPDNQTLFAVLLEFGTIEYNDLEKKLWDIIERHVQKGLQLPFDVVVAEAFPPKVMYSRKLAEVQYILYKIFLTGDRPGHTRFTRVFKWIQPGEWKGEPLPNLPASAEGGPRAKAGPRVRHIKDAYHIGYWYLKKYYKALV